MATPQQQQQVNQGQAAANQTWDLVQNQWDVAVKIRWQQLQAIVNALEVIIT